MGKRQAAASGEQPLRLRPCACLGEADARAYGSSDRAGPARVPGVRPGPAAASRASSRAPATGTAAAKAGPEAPARSRGLGRRPTHALAMRAAVSSRDRASGPAPVRGYG